MPAPMLRRGRNGGGCVAKRHMRCSLKGPFNVVTGIRLGVLREHHLDSVGAGGRWVVIGLMGGGIEMQGFWASLLAKTYSNDRVLPLAPVSPLTRPSCWRGWRAALAVVRRVVEPCGQASASSGCDERPCRLAAGDKIVGKVILVQE